ncbi:hypothetical protein D3C79_832970 [compost metagenome]
MLQQVEVGCRCARLGHGIEKAAEGDIAGALAGRLPGQVELRVAGRADDRVAAEQGAGGCQRAVGLAQVHTHAQPRSQFGVVIDDQLRAVAFAELLQRFGFAQAAGRVIALVAVLQQAHAAVQGRFDMGQETAGEQLAVGNCVQTA